MRGCCLIVRDIDTAHRCLDSGLRQYTLDERDRRLSVRTAFEGENVDESSHRHILPWALPGLGRPHEDAPREPKRLNTR